VKTDDDHGKTDPWSNDPFPKQRHYGTERHHVSNKPKVAPPAVEVQPSKMAAVEKAVNMAQRTREMISKLGAFKQLEGSSSFADSSVQPSAVFSSPEKLPETKAAESTAINKIRQNTSLVKYAFNLPVETEHSSTGGSSVPSHDIKSSWTGDAEHRFDSTYQTAEPDHSRETVNYAAASVNSSASYEGNTAVYSQQSTWNAVPKATEEPAKGDSCDPTIANILKSIGFNFELSNMMQDKARKEPSTVNQASSPELLLQSNTVPSLYEEKANRYRAEQMRQYGTVNEPDNEESLQLCGAADSSADKPPLHVLQLSYDNKPFADDVFEGFPPVDFKLKFKSSEANACQKSGTLYEDFSDSDDDFIATTKPGVNVESKSKVGPVSQSVASTSVFGNDGMLQQVPANKTADDLDWEFSTEEFIRKLQEPRPPERTVTVMPKSELTRHTVVVPASQDGSVAGNTSEIQNDNLKLAKSFVPLEELKTIKKTIFVSGSPFKTDLTVGKSDLSSSMKSSGNSYAYYSDQEKTPRLQQQGEGSSKSTEKVSIDIGRKKKRGSAPEDNSDARTTGSKVRKLDTDLDGASKERQKKIDALLREQENLKRQQNILMRRKKREKDADKDPFLIENSKLQEEICSQIEKLRRASMKDLDESERQRSDQVHSAVSITIRLR